MAGTDFPRRLGHYTTGRPGPTVVICGGLHGVGVDAGGGGSGEEAAVVDVATAVEHGPCKRQSTDQVVVLVVSRGREDVCRRRR